MAQMNDEAYGPAQLAAYLQSRGVADARVLAAFRTVPRHAFVPPAYGDRAYDNIALPIGEGQVITQPSLVATMTQALALTGTETLLEVGTGSGYQAAILSRLAHIVYTIERIPALARRATDVFNRLGLTNIHVFVGDGTLGLPHYAPYDAIMVTAAGPQVPQPLIDQLRDGGRLVVPLAHDRDQHTLMVGRKQAGTMQFAESGAVCFVPLIGQHGWHDGQG